MSILKKRGSICFRLVSMLLFKLLYFNWILFIQRSERNLFTDEIIEKRLIVQPSTINWTSIWSWNGDNGASNSIIKVRVWLDFVWGKWKNYRYLGLERLFICFDENDVEQLSVLIQRPTSHDVLSCNIFTDERILRFKYCRNAVCCVQVAMIRLQCTFHPIWLHKYQKHKAINHKYSFINDYDVIVFLCKQHIQRPSTNLLNNVNEERLVWWQPTRMKLDQTHYMFMLSLHLQQICCVWWWPRLSSLSQDTHTLNQMKVSSDYNIHDWFVELDENHYCPFFCVQFFGVRLHCACVCESVSMKVAHNPEFLNGLICFQRFSISFFVSLSCFVIACHSCGLNDAGKLFPNRIQAIQLHHKKNKIPMLGICWCWCS